MEIPWQAIEKDTLVNMIEEFVSRDGTDYGEVEFTLEQKVNRVLLALKTGKAKILYDEQSECCEIVAVP